MKDEFPIFRCLNCVYWGDKHWEVKGRAWADCNLLSAESGDERICVLSEEDYSVATRHDFGCKGHVPLES